MTYNVFGGTLSLTQSVNHVVVVVDVVLGLERKDKHDLYPVKFAFTVFFYEQKGSFPVL